MFELNAVTSCFQVSVPGLYAWCPETDKKLLIYMKHNIIIEIQYTTTNIYLKHHNLLWPHLACVTAYKQKIYHWLFRLLNRSHMETVVNQMLAKM